MTTYAIRDTSTDRYVVGMGRHNDTQMRVFTTQDADTAFSFGHMAAVCLKASLETFVDGDFVIVERA